jgi:carboxyl-terminal processing protease
MSAATPEKQFLHLCYEQVVRLLLGALALFFVIIPVSGQEVQGQEFRGQEVRGQEPPRLFIPKTFSSERPVPQLTPSGRSLVDRYVVERHDSTPMVPSTPMIPSTPVIPAAPVEMIAPQKPLPQPLPRLEPLPVLSSTGQEGLDQIIQEGKALEAELRWADALAHYESALRLYRNETALMDRYRIARFQCDVGRRFHDSSYLEFIRTLTVVETLNFFEEVITQIQEEYADMPRWEPLFQHGMQSFSIALTDANFRAKVHLNVSYERINAYLSGMQTTVNGWQIRGREDMKNGMLHIAEGAQKQLGLNPVVTMMEFTCGVVSSLDPNTTYLTPNQLKDQWSVINGNLVGLGVELRSDRESLHIVRVIPGSPAEESGLKEGDRILAVDGTSTRGRDTNSAADLLHGSEGTVVALSILSAGFGQRARDVSITRRQIEVPSVEDVRMINNELGYIKLTNFQSKTRWELIKALSDLNQRGMRCLVLDLRRNPGGLFSVGIDVANMFIERGAIVRTQGRGFGPDAPSMASGETWHVPLIILIDEESASAAEIVAGAIRDHNRGVLIGRRTYGKGTIQKIIPVLTGAVAGARSGIKLTTEKFYSPQGWAYSGVGVTPHIPISKEEETQRMALARPLNGMMPLPVPRPITSSLDDPFIQEAVQVSRDLLK